MIKNIELSKTFTLNIKEIQILKIIMQIILIILHQN